MRRAAALLLLLGAALPASAALCQVVPTSMGEAIGDVAAICIAMGI